MKSLHHTDGCDTPALMGGLRTAITTELCGFPGTSTPYIMFNVTSPFLGYWVLIKSSN